MDKEENCINALILLDKNQPEEAARVASQLIPRSSIYNSVINAKTAVINKDLEAADYLLVQIKAQSTRIKDLKTREFLVTCIQVTEAEIKAASGEIEIAIGDLERFLNSNRPSYTDYIETVLAKLRKAGPEFSTRSQERTEFVKVFNTNFNVTPNSKWHIIDSRWFAMWEGYVGATEGELNAKVAPATPQGKPGKIDNSRLLVVNVGNDTLEDDAHPYFSYSLKSGLVEGTDFVLVPDKAFQLLLSYGVQQDIIRYAIEQNDTIYQIELYLKTVTVAFIERNTLVIKKFHTSRKNNIGYIRKLVLRKLNVHCQSRSWKVDLFKLPLTRLKTIAMRTFTVYLDSALVVDDHMIIDDAELTDSNLLLIETNQTGKYIYSDDVTLTAGKCAFCQSSSQKFTCKTCNKKLYCSLDCCKHHQSEHSRICKQKPKRTFFSVFACFCRPKHISDTDDDSSAIVSLPSVLGSKSQKLVGLENLGNTCFMNSALQCLYHTKLLTDFFTAGEHLNKINKSNPLGTKGRLAFDYAEFLHSMRTCSGRAVAPWKLKKTIAQFAPQFVGHQQHDAHELLLFLISGLHEDLNQVIKKPYYESEVKEASDYEMAAESWKRHLARNQSIIIDLVYGQYKSTVQCPKCQKLSYAFDPFSCLSLPIPQIGQKKLQIVYLPYCLSIEPMTYFTQLVDPTSTLAEIVTNCYKYLKKQNTFSVLFGSSSPNSDALDSAARAEEVKSGTLMIYEVHEEPKQFVIVNLYKENAYSSECYPRILTVKKRFTFEMLHSSLFEFLKPHITNLSPTDTYGTLLAQQVYKVTFNPNRENLCFKCGANRCKGCEITPNSERPACFYSGRSFFSVNVMFSRASRKTIDPVFLKKYVQAKATAELPVKKNCSIYDCFNHFKLPEILDKNNLWYCPNCKVQVQASKRLEIYKVPPILIIHLKRFKTHGFYREKLTSAVEFPMKDLDISEHVIGATPALYDLYAVSHHFGALAGGHYTASVLVDSKWFNCNDSEISECKELSEVSSYVLFYKAKQSA